MPVTRSGVGTTVSASEVDFIDTDSAMTANSDTKVASQKATKTADAAAVATAEAFATALDLGRQVKDPVRLATATALPTNARVTNVLTATAFGALAVDSVNVAVGDRILVKNEATQANNGIYVVTATGGGAAFFVLTRSADANTSAEIKSGMSVFAGPDGSANASSGWELTADDPITLNTTNLTFQQFTALGEVTAGSGLTKSGNTLAADFGTASGKVTQGNDSRFTTVTANTQTDTYTLVLGDAGLCIEMNKGTAVTLTVPTNASVAFSVGTVIQIAQIGAGQVTVAAAGGVTIDSAGARLKLVGQYSTATLRKRATDEWVLSGDVSS